MIEKKKRGNTLEVRESHFHSPTKRRLCLSTNGARALSGVFLTISSRKIAGRE